MVVVLILLTLITEDAIGKAAEVVVAPAQVPVLA